MSETKPAWDEYFAGLGATLRDVVAHFNSLGYNCEFGFVQAANEFEDHSLLTWAHLNDTGGVIHLLEERFAGLFARDRLVPAVGGAMLRDRHFGIAFHSKMLVREEDGALVPTPEAERDAIHADDISKIRHLTEKMQRQLTGAARIWLYKSQAPIGLGQILALHGALSAYGRNRLLVVEPRPDRPPGVEMLDQDLYLGHLPAYSPPNEAWRFDPAGWSTILRATLRLAGMLH